MRFPLLAILCIAIGAIGLSQSPGEQDSIRTERNHSKFDSLIHIDTDKAKTHLDSMLWIAQKDTYPKALYFYQFDKAYYHFTRHEMEASYANFEKALAHAEALNLPSEVIMSTIWLANHHFFENNTEEARLGYRNALALSEEIDFIYGIANAYFGLSTLETDEENALKYLIKIDSIYEQKNTTSPILANTLGEIGRLYLESNNHAKARQYLEKSLKVARATNYLPGISNYPVVLGDMALKEGNFDEAYRYYELAFEESARRKDTFNLAHMYKGLARIDMKTGQLQQAEKKLQTSLGYFQELKDSVSLTDTSLTLAELYLKKKELPKAKFYLDYVDRFGHRYPANNFQMKFLKTSVGYWIQAGDYRQAFLAQIKMDSLENIERIGKNSEAFMALEQQYNAHKKEQEIILLRSQNQLSAQQKKNQRNLLLGGMSLSSLIGVFFFLQYRNRQKTNKKLRELDTFKSNFFANISHEFRTPLTLISASVERKLSDKNLKEEDRCSFEMLQRNNDRLLELVDQLLDLSKIEAGNLSLRIQEGNATAFIGTIADSFTYAAELKNINYVRYIDPSVQKVWFDKDALEKIVVNLLSNAIKYTPKKGSVELKLLRNNEQLTIEVKNTGKGLSQEQLIKIFERFYQVDEHQEGTGIGLALVNELVTLHKGGITASSETNGWTSFTVTLPIDKRFFKDSEIFSSVKSSDVQDALPAANIPDLDAEDILNNEMPVLLVVDDNKDVRSLLKSTFKSTYSVVSAKNGEEGIQKALEHIPDLIVSDIMMPGTDGLELCGKLKSDVLTSHIPIILLTARAGEEDQYKGLSLGADAYVTKPFRVKLLRTRVDSLIESRKVLRKRYGQEVILKPKDIAITNLDEQFLEKIQNVLDEKLTGSNFSAQEFSVAMGMSRMQLHRKLKALTGLTTSEFVRSQRLRLAASLLEKSDANVSQIGYRVGFNDPSYFTRCFKEAYGCSPTEFTSE